jgi:hypothetical protein
MKKFNLTIKTMAMLAMVAGVVTLQSCKEDKKEDVTLPQIGGYNNADEVGASSLVAKWSFDENYNEAKQNLSGTNNGGSLVAGKKGKAYKGGTGAFVGFNNAGNALPALKSFTTAFWMNTEKHEGGAQSVFMLSKDSAFWGNFFFLIEGGTSDSMFCKVHFEKNDAPAWKEQWVEFNGTNRIPNAFGKWNHITFSYDAASSKFAMYVNGAKLTLAPGTSDRYGNDPAAGGAPLGNLNFINANKFVVGGFQNNLGAPWSTPETWMLNYTGMLDEFRVYSKALADADVKALYDLETAGR